MQGDQQDKHDASSAARFDPNFTSDERIAYERSAGKAKKKLPSDAARDEEAGNRTRAFRSMLREGYDPMVGVATDKPPHASAASASTTAAGARHGAKGTHKGHIVIHRGPIKIPRAVAMATDGVDGGFPWAILASLIPAAIPLITKGVEWIVKKIRGKGALEGAGARKTVDAILRRRYKRFAKKYGHGATIKTGEDFWARLADIVHNELTEIIPEILDMKNPDLVNKLSAEAVHKMLPKSFLKHVHETREGMTGPGEEIAGSDEEDEGGEGVDGGFAFLDKIMSVLGSLFGIGGSVGGEGEGADSTATADFLFPVMDWAHRKVLKAAGTVGGEGALDSDSLREEFHDFMEKEGAGILAGGGPFWDRVKLISKKFLNQVLPALTNATKHIAKPVLTAILNKFGVATDGPGSQFLLDLIPGLIPDAKPSKMREHDLDLVDARTAEEKEREEERKKRKEAMEKKGKEKEKKGKGFIAADRVAREPILRTRIAPSHGYNPREPMLHEDFDLSDDIAASGRRLWGKAPRGRSPRPIAKRHAKKKTRRGGEGYLWS